MKTLAERCAAFRSLHESGCFVVANPWDVGSARLLEQLGFQALATSSAGFAWTQGRPDNGVTRDEVLAHYRAVSDAVGLPVNGDFEGAFATSAEGVHESVALVVTTGVAGVSVEDSTGDPTNPLFDFDLSVERIAAARRAIDESGSGVLLTARSEGFIVGRPDLAETIRRLTAYAEAGAECLFAPGIREAAQISAVVGAVAPKPVNVVMGTNSSTVQALADLGVRRISVGGGLARVALTAFLESAREIADQGTFEGLSRAMPFADMNGLFQSAARR